MGQRSVAPCALALALLWPTWLQAHDAEDEPESPPPAPLEDESAPPQIIVRGERAPRAASGVVRKRDLLGAAPQGNGSELLRTIPGVFVSQHSGQGKAHQIFFRGFDAVHGQDIELWVAGAPVNEVSNVHGQGYADLHFVMPEVVRQIDALPGTYDPSQGDFAVAGTMRFTLGYDEPGTTIQAGYGSFNARRLFLAYHPRNAAAETFGAFELFETDGFGPGRAAQRASAIGQLVHPIEDDLHLRVMLSSYAGHFGSAGVLRQQDVDRGRIDRFDSHDLDQGGHSTRTQLVAELLHDDGRTELSLSPYLVLRNLRLRYNYTGYLIHPELGDSTQQENDATTAGFRGRYRQRLDIFRADDALEFGVAARSDWIEQGQHYRSRRRLTDPLVEADIHATTLGGYVDAELHPVRRLLLRGGVRADAASFSVREPSGDQPQRTSQGSFVGEKLVADLALLPRLHAIASWGRGFRTPQARSVVHGARVPFTKVRSAELGIRWADSRQRASLATYWTDLTDDVVFDETLGRNEPVPGTRRLGVAAHLETNHSDWFVSGVGATVTRAVFEQAGGRYQAGQLVPFVPQVVTRADLAARPHLGTWSGRAVRGHFGIGIQGLFRRPLPYNEFGRDAVVSDVRLGLRTDEVELHLDVRNLLGLDWNDGEFVYASRFDPSGTASSIPARHFTAGEPFSLFLSATLHL